MSPTSFASPARMKVFTLSFCVVACAAVVAWPSAPAFGWGAGHGTQARMVLPLLPQEIKDFLGPACLKEVSDKHCYYPDCVKGWFPEEIGQAAIDELNGLKLTPGTLHDDPNAALSFMMLNHAFLEKNPKHAALWIGALNHNIGDNGSHLPLMAYLSALNQYANVQPPKVATVKMGPGFYDLSQIEGNAQDQAQVKKLLAGFVPKPITDDPSIALRKLVVSAFSEMDYGAMMQSRLCSSFDYTPDKKIPGDAMAAAVELGVHGSEQIANAVVTAWELAKQGKRVQWEPETIKKAQADALEFCNTKPLEHDTVYAGTLDSKPAGPAVGVLVENSTFMGRARFSYVGCVVLGQAMRAMKAAKVPYLPLDIRQVEKDAQLPSVDKMPVLVLCSGGFYVNEEPFKKYIAAGGKILWIANMDKGLLGKLSDSLKPADVKLLPVGNDYEDAKHEGAAAVARVKVKFMNEYGKVLGTEPRKFVNNPNTSGWTTMHCNNQIVSTDPSIRILAAVTDGQSTMNLAGALMENGKARHIFLPQYFLLPFTLSQDSSIRCGQTEFDSTGKKIFLTSIKMLAPELCKSKS